MHAPARPRATLQRLVLAVCLLALASAASALQFPAAGSREHSFFLWPQRTDDGTFTAVYHIPADLPLGSIRPAPRISGEAAHVATRGGRTVFVYEAQQPPIPQAGGSLPSVPAPTLGRRRVEAITVVQGPIEGAYEYRPRGRDPEALPSLPAEGRLAGLALTDRGLLALLDMRATDSPPAQPAEGAGEPAPWSLLLLDDTSWKRAPLPEGFRPDADHDLVALDARVLLVERGADATRGWTADVTALDEAAHGKGAADWRPEALPALTPEEALLAVGEHLVAWSREPDGAVRLRLVRGEGAHELARIPGVRDSFGVLPLRDAVAAVWLEPPQGRLRMAAVSVISGQTLYDELARPAPIVSGRDLQTLALLLGAVLLTALIFILRPEPGDQQVVVLPEGTSLAGPGRRLIAFLIDLLPPLWLGSILFDVSLRDVLAAALMSERAAARGAGAFLSGIALTIALTTIGEWRTGQTIGKWAMRLRTATTKGERPRLWQALVRNSLKLLCPPLALFLLLNPARRHPADILARTVVLGSAPEPKSPDPSGPA